MQKPSHHLRPPQSYIHGLEKTNEYLGFLSQGKERTIALGRVAGMFAERMAHAEQQTVEKQLDHLAVRILSTLPDFTYAQHALDEENAEKEHRRHAISREEELSCKRTVTAYNHMLRELVDTAPDIKVVEIKDFVFKAMLDMGTPHEAKYCAQETQFALAGIQHEIGLEQTVWQIDGVEDVVHGDEQQEHFGIDLLVDYRGLVIPLDAKASDLSVQKTLQKLTTYKRQHGIAQGTSTGGYPVWSGLETADFEGGFRIPEELAAKNAPRVEAILKQLYIQQKTA